MECEWPEDCNCTVTREQRARIAELEGRLATERAAHQRDIDQIRRMAWPTDEVALGLRASIAELEGKLAVAQGALGRIRDGILPVGFHAREIAEKALTAIAGVRDE
jgi:hypothetical protein